MENNRMILERWSQKNKENDLVIFTKAIERKYESAKFDSNYDELLYYPIIFNQFGLMISHCDSSPHYSKKDFKGQILKEEWWLEGKFIKP